MARTSHQRRQAAAATRRRRVFASLGGPTHDEVSRAATRVAAEAAHAMPAEVPAAKPQDAPARAEERDAGQEERVELETSRGAEPTKR